VRIFSYGGGVQSNAVMVLQATGKIKPFDYFVFANVGDDSENPDTLEYIDQYAKPYMVKHGIEYIEVFKTMKDGSRETVRGRIYRTPKSVVIPMQRRGNAPYRHVCSVDFKQRVVNKWTKKHTHKCVMGIGMSIDEISRVRSTKWHEMDGKIKLGFMRKLEYPLIDLMVSRFQCEQIIHDVRLPVPPRSACFFCPVTKPDEWIEMRKNAPNLFAQAVAIEKHINTKREEPPHDQLYIHRALVPLDIAVGGQAALPLQFDDECSAGSCFT